MQFDLAARETNARRAVMKIRLFWYEVAYVNNH